MLYKNKSFVNDGFYQVIFLKEFYKSNECNIFVMLATKCYKRCAAVA